MLDSFKKIAFIEKYSMKILACTLIAFVGNCANAATPARVTVTVKKLVGMTESGDGYTFKTTAGKEYYVYSAGGGVLIPGGNFIVKSAEKGVPICLKLASPGELGDVSSVTSGVCKR